MSERASAAEPGAASNVPRQLQTMNAPTRSTSDTDDQNSSKVVPSFTITEKEFQAAMPKAVHVSVSIPDEYYRDVALARGISEGSSDADKATFRQSIEAIRTEEEEKARKHALTLIPAGSPVESVHVTSVTRLAPKVVVALTPWSAQIERAARQWGGTAGLALLAIWGLWTLRKHTPAIPSISTSAQAGQQRLAAVLPLEEEDLPAPPPSRRDVLQSFVRDNPEATAAVINKWIQAAK